MDLKAKVVSPCIGVCSTGIGDSVCRGCKRFVHEIIDWNAYSVAQKSVVMNRIHQLLAQVVAGKVTVSDPDLLCAKLKFQQIRFDSQADPHCWVFDLLKAGASQIENIEDYGCVKTEEFKDCSFTQIKEEIDRDFYTLSSVHYERYFANQN